MLTRYHITFTLPVLTNLPFKTIKISRTFIVFLKGYEIYRHKHFMDYFLNIILIFQQTSISLHMITFFAYLMSWAITVTVWDVIPSNCKSCPTSWTTCLYYTSAWMRVGSKWLVNFVHNVVYIGLKFFLEVVYHVCESYSAFMLIFDCFVIIITAKSVTPGRPIRGNVSWDLIWFEI